jgi:hypothetical protein
VRRLRRWYERRGSPTLGKAGVLLVVVALVTAGLYLVIWRPRADSDQSAIRAWFGSSAGGKAPADVTRALGVSDCSYTRFELHGKTVYACDIAFEQIRFVGCFTIDDDDHVEGGWPVSLDGCSSVRWSARRSGFVDQATGQPPSSSG